jgi:hypothetical protein
VETPQVATASQCGEITPDGHGPESTPSEGSGFATGNAQGGWGSRGVSPLERSRPPSGQRDSMSGNKIRSRAAPQNRWSPVCRNKNATSRGKRQDPWRRANDPAQAGCRPCGRRSHRGNRFRNRDVTRFGGPHARKHAVWPGPEASPGMPHRGVTTAVAGFATEPERSAWSVPDRRSVGELAAKRHSTGEAERQMPVTGERECGELPPPFFTIVRRRQAGLTRLGSGCPD